VGLPHVTNDPEGRYRRAIVEAASGIKGVESVDFPRYQVSIVDDRPNEATQSRMKEIPLFQSGETFQFL
jgi:hypothetical protein